MNQSLLVGACGVLTLLLSGCRPEGINPAHWAPTPIGASAHEWIVGEETDARAGWDQFFSTPQYIYGTDPTPFVKRAVERIPTGRALVLAVGEGRDAVYLARKGFQVEGVDISQVALMKARRLAKRYQVDVHTVVAGLKDYEIEPSAYDLIVNVTYFRESVVEKVKRGLKAGGFVIFQNYLVDHLKNPQGMSIPQKFLVQPGQLSSLFSDFRIVEYHESNDGRDALAQILAQKTGD